MTKPDDHGIGGLTKRELFAALLMAGFAVCDVSDLPKDDAGDSTGETVAELAVAWADCLIAELNEEQEAQ